MKNFIAIDGIISGKLEITLLNEPNLIIIEKPLNDLTLYQSKVLQINNEELGYLHWACQTPYPDGDLIDNFVQLIARAIYYNRAQQQADQLLLLEERAIIARELHDSLAQSLSYLKIQMSLLKRNINTYAPTSLDFNSTN